MESLFLEALHLEDAEYSHHPQQPQHCERLRGRDKQTQIGWKNGEKIDDTPERKYVFLWMFQTVDAQVVLEGEQ